MSAERFTLDTNILVYSVEPAADARFSIASDIMDRAPHCDCPIALQAISEFYVAVIRKRKLTVLEAAAQANDWLVAFTPMAASAVAIRMALRCAAEGRASYWDALLAATAAEAGCHAILSEDMANGSVLFGVRIVNPFAGGVLSAAAEALLAG